MLTLLLATTVAAWPCAGLVHRSGELAESADAEVLLTARDDGRSSATWQVGYEGDSAAFGWIVPIPGPFVDIVDAPLDLFDELREDTSPNYEKASDSGGRPAAGCLCGASPVGSREGALDANAQLVYAEGFTGSYEYTVLDAASADFDAWLDDNGWELGDAAEDVDHYAALGYPLVLLRIAPDQPDTPEEGRSLPSVEITWDGEALVFPSVMARHAEVAEQRTTVWIYADTRAEVTGWTHEVGGTVSAPEDASPDAVWHDLIADAGADQGWILSWAGEYDDRFLTRFDTLAPREVHTVDATFELTDSTARDHVDIVIGDPVDEAWVGGVAPLLLLLLGAGVRRTRRQG